MHHLGSNIPSSLLYRSIFSEFLRIARCTLLLNDFTPRASVLYQRMKTQGDTDKMLLVQIIKAACFTLRYPEIFLKFDKELEELAHHIGLMTSV